MNGLELKGLEVRRGDFIARWDDLAIPAGTIAALSGASGSGKTTLLEAIAGFIPATGVVLVNGEDVSAFSPERRRVGLVFQRASLFPHWNVEDNVAFGLRVQGVGKVDRRRTAAEWLHRVGLEGFGARRIAQLSEGQAQRVALARVLATGFPVLLLDEPFSALDAATRSELRELLRKLVRETRLSALLVSHHPEDVADLADREYRQENGNCFSVGRGG